jgi:hypothetical protein
MTIAKQIAVVIQLDLNGAPIETVRPAAGQEFGTIAIVGDTVPVSGYQVTLTPARTKQWTALFGVPGAATAFKYLVNDNAIPACPYSSIQDAIDDAVLDGHGPAVPAVVTVLPGSYIEDVAMVAGISVVAFTSPARGVAVTLTGDVTFDLAASTPTALVGISVIGSVVVSGDATQNVLLQGVTVVAVGDAVAASNTSALSTLRMLDCALAVDAAAPNGRALRATTAIDITARDCEFAHADGDLIACDVAAGVTYRFIQCRVFGSQTLDDATGRLEDCFVQALVTGIVKCPVAFLLNGAAFVISGGVVACDNNPAYEGVGVVEPTGAITYTINSNQDPTISNTRVGTRFYYTDTNVAGAGPHAFPLTRDTLCVDTEGLAAAVTLTDLLETANGTQLTIKSLDAAGAITVTDPGGAMIDGAASYVIVAPFGVATFQANHEEGLWMVLVQGSVSTFGAERGVSGALSTVALAGAPEIAAQFPAGIDDVVSGYATRLRVVLSCAGGGTASVQLRNLTAAVLVEIGGPLVTVLTHATATPTVVTSVDLIGAVGFNPAVTNVYQLEVFSSNALLVAMLGIGELIHTA